MYPPNVIANKYTEKVISNKLQPGKKLSVRSIFSVEYKRKFTFFLVNTKNISSRVMNNINYHLCYALVKNTDFFTALDEIYLVLSPKK